MSMSNFHRRRPWREVPLGAIYEVARAAGLELLEREGKCELRCPFHDDQAPSAVLFESNHFHCSVCLPGASLSLLQFARALNVHWRPVPWRPDRMADPPESTKPPAFSPQDAQSAWEQMLARAEDTRQAALDSDTFGYVAGRGLADACYRQLFGVIGRGMKLPRALWRWHGGGYRLVCPLYDLAGQLVSLQARAIRDVKPKVRNPVGAQVAGTLLASPSGLEVLRRQRKPPGTILVGEGLTDHLALSVASSAPVLCLPGVSMAKRSGGDWMAGWDLVIATDADEPGRTAFNRLRDVAAAAGASKLIPLEWPDGCKDACVVVERHGLDGLRQVLRAVGVGGNG